MSSFQDRLRVPWRGGAKQVSLDAALPLVLQPLLACLAVQGAWCTAAVFVSACAGACYLRRLFPRFHPRSKFFLVWTLTSAALLLLVFEVDVVPLLEILPGENGTLVLLVLAALGCAQAVRLRAPLCHAGAEEEGGIPCAVCRRLVPPRTYHCRTCQACVLARDHHCVWLDCCIGERNRHVFMLSLLLSVASLAYGAVLTLTTVCHPFFFMELVLLPDDCSDVYHDSQMALCFVSALYCLLLAVLLLAQLVHQCVLVSLGQTGQEWRLAGRPCCGPRSDRPYSRGLLRNWARFLSCRKG
ncbi:palmitoyltransferase ZDHHC23-B isoform X2 [Bacillus rossius redtenbacheri]